jgi:hypothetical protein
MGTYLFWSVLLGLLRLAFGWSATPGLTPRVVLLDNDRLTSLAKIQPKT